MGARSRRGRSITLARDPFCGKGPKAAEPKSEVTVTEAGEEGTATRGSLREYAAVQRMRYQGASRAEKHRLLNEIVAVTGIHRKAAIRLLRRAPRPPGMRARAGRPCASGPAVGSAEVLWHASSRIGAGSHSFVGELLERLLR